LNIKKNSLSLKTFSYLIIFSISILLFLWIFQLLFLTIFYEKYQINTIRTAATTILNSKDNLIENLESIAYKNDICIELHSANQIYNYNILNNNCILNNNNVNIVKAKRELLNSATTKELIRIDDPRYNTKSILYGVRLNSDTYVILNTKIEDINSTTYILRNQLIYITLIVIVISFVVSYFVSRMLNKPILKITKKARAMGEGNYDIDTEKYNIAELDELNDVLNYARSEIKNTDELRRDLMANVSHDLKTPLTMIKAYAEMARDINNDNEEKRIDNLNIIIAESDRLNTLVNDILELSKMQNGSSKLELTNYDLIEELNGIIKRYEIIKETEHYKFILNTPEIAPVYADKNKINQVLYNLINNAINYTGKDLTVTINVKENRNNYLIEIIDTGKGLTAEEIKIIWNKYYKNEKNHQRNVIGTGLGLSIVKTILNNHNFDFGVKSEKGKGSNFYFKIKKAKI